MIICIAGNTNMVTVSSSRYDTSTQTDFPLIESTTVY